MVTREVVDRLKKVQNKGSLGEKLLRHMERQVEEKRKEIRDDRAMRLASFLKPRVERGGCVFREDVEDRVEPELLRLFDEVSKVSGGLRRYVGPYQVVTLLERARGK